MKCLIVIWFIVFLSACKVAPRLKGCITISSINFYKDFWAGGYTNAGALRHFNDLEKANTPKFKLGKEDVDSLLNIISRTKVKKLFPGKTGTFILFAEFVYTNDSVARVIIQTNLIRNYTLNKDYWVKDGEDQEWLLEFKNRIKKHSMD